MRKEREKRTVDLLGKIIGENFPNLGKDTSTHVQGTEEVPNKMKPKSFTSRHILIKMVKVKEKKIILNASTEKQLTIYMRTPIKLSAELSDKIGRVQGGMAIDSAEFSEETFKSEGVA